MALAGKLLEGQLPKQQSAFFNKNTYECRVRGYSDGDLAGKLPSLRNVLLCLCGGDNESRFKEWERAYEGPFSRRSIEFRTLRLIIDLRQSTSHTQRHPSSTTRHPSSITRYPSSTRRPSSTTVSPSQHWYDSSSPTLSSTSHQFQLVYYGPTIKTTLKNKKVDSVSPTLAATVNDGEAGDAIQSFLYKLGYAFKYEFISIGYEYIFDSSIVIRVFYCQKLLMKHDISSAVGIDNDESVESFSTIHSRHPSSITHDHSIDEYHPRCSTTWLVDIFSITHNQNIDDCCNKIDALLELLTPYMTRTSLKATQKK